MMKPSKSCSRIMSSKFRWDPVTRTFVAEVSELVDKLFLTQVWDDACDAGFVMVSTKTGREVIFVHTRVREGEWEVMSWEFQSHGFDGEQMKVLIFND